MSDTPEHWAAWKLYGKRAGFLDETGTANNGDEGRVRAATACNAFMAGMEEAEKEGGLTQEDMRQAVIFTIEQCAALVEVEIEWAKTISDDDPTTKSYIQHFLERLFEQIMDQKERV